MEELSQSSLWFASAYLLVLVIGVLHTTFNVHVMRLPVRNEKGLGEAYSRTRRYHPIYNLIVYSYTGWLFMRATPYSSGMLAIRTGIIWALLAAICDMIFGVLIKHPFSQNFRQFYIEYQPWLALSYLAVFIGPLIGFALI